MRIALVDDDLTQTEQLSGMISEELNTMGDHTHSITAFESGEAFLAAWQPGDFDLIVLDIYMGALTGIDVAYRIRQADDHVHLAFCTSSNEFASESYEVGAQHYLRKPVTAAAVTRLFKRLNLDAMEMTRSVRLPDGHKVMLRKILYTEYANHAVTIYTSCEPPYRLRISQTELEALLFPCGYFCSPHKGLTVNFHAIETLTDSTIILSSGISLPLSRRKAKDVKDAYKKFRFDQMRKEVGV